MYFFIDRYLKKNEIFCFIKELNGILKQIFQKFYVKNMCFYLNILFSNKSTLTRVV